MEIEGHSQGEGGGELLVAGSRVSLRGWAAHALEEAVQDLVVMT